MVRISGRSPQFAYKLCKFRNVKIIMQKRNKEATVPNRVSVEQSKNKPQYECRNGRNVVTHFLLSCPLRQNTHFRIVETYLVVPIVHCQKIFSLNFFEVAVQMLEKNNLMSAEFLMVQILRFGRPEMRSTCETHLS